LGGAGGVDDLVGELEVGVVEDVEELGAELQAGALGELGGFEEGEVPVGEAGAGQGVSADVADEAGGGGGEGVGVEELRGAG
jgi:hypothetical protein